MQASLHTDICLYVANVICLTTLPYTECDVICKNVYIVNMQWVAAEAWKFLGVGWGQGWNIWGGSGSNIHQLWPISLLLMDNFITLSPFLFVYFLYIFFRSVDGNDPSTENFRGRGTKSLSALPHPHFCHLRSNMFWQK